MEDIFNYSEDFKKIISEMFKEMKNGITDGLLCKTSGIEDERNLLDKKGYAPIQLVVIKALREKKYIQLAKTMAYH